MGLSLFTFLLHLFIRLFFSALILFLLLKHDILVFISHFSFLLRLYISECWLSRNLSVYLSLFPFPLLDVNLFFQSEICSCVHCVYNVLKCGNFLCCYILIPTFQFWFWIGLRTFYAWFVWVLRTENFIAFLLYFSFSWLESDARWEPVAEQDAALHPRPRSRRTTELPDAAPGSNGHWRRHAHARRKRNIWGAHGKWEKE